jgi:hypothetical protein
MTMSPSLFHRFHFPAEMTRLAVGLYLCNSQSLHDLGRLLATPRHRRDRQAESQGRIAVLAQGKQAERHT